MEGTIIHMLKVLKEAKPFFQDDYMREKIEKAIKKGETALRVIKECE